MNMSFSQGFSYGMGFIGFMTPVCMVAFLAILIGYVLGKIYKDE